MIKMKDESINIEIKLWVKYLVKKINSEGILEEKTNCKTFGKVKN